MFKTLLFLGVLLLAAPSYAVTTLGYGKQAAEIFVAHPTNALCTRVATTVGSTSYRQAILFNSVNATTGCKVLLTGIVPPSAGSSYQLLLRMYYTTAAATSKVVGLGVRPWALVPWTETESGVERKTSTTQTTVTSGSARNFVSDQIQFVELFITVKMPNGSDCDSSCDNAELVMLIEPTSSMTIPDGAFYLLDYQVFWVH